MVASVWGDDGLDHKYCDEEYCTADGTVSTDPSCPKHTGGHSHDCNY